MHIDLKQEAARLYSGGLCVLPAMKETKRPVGAWREYREKRRVVNGAFDRCNALAVVCGAVSGNVEVIDFDANAVDFDDWAQRVAELDADAAQTLFSCVLETTQSGGKHLAYRCAEPVDGNLKLTTRTFEGASKTTIETRGEGGVVIVAPTAGYRVERGDWAATPVISAATRRAFLDAARSLAETPEKPSKPPPVSTVVNPVDGGDSIADWLRANGYVTRLLVANGWRYVKTRGGNEHWRRPGKDDGISGTLSLEKQCFYVFSSNAAPLEPNRAYSALQLAAAFDFGGDEKAAARHYLDERDATRPLPAQTIIVEPLKKTEPKNDGEVVFPQSLRECGGLIGELMSYTESQEIKPQPTLRLAGAFALMSYLTARKIATFGDVRTNLHIVGLAESGGGKDAARSANSKILTACGAPAFPEQYKSASAFWKTLQLHGAVFSQIDEFGIFLKAVNADTSHLKALTGAFLKAFSLSNYEQVVVDVGVTNHKADSEPLVYPSFTCYGTSTFTDFADSMTEKQLTNGFLARCSIFAGDSNVRRNYRDYMGYVSPSPPADLVAQCRAWLNYRSTFAVETPVVFNVPVDLQAKAILLKNLQRAEDAQRGASEAERTFFARVDEKARKYALIFAASKYGPNEETLRVDAESASLAVALCDYEVAFFRRLLAEEVATSVSESVVLKVKKWIKELETKQFTKSEFTRKFQRLSVREREEALQTLVDSDVVEKVFVDVGRMKKTLFIVTE